MAFKTPEEIRRERDKRERERTLNRIADAAFDAAAGAYGCCVDCDGTATAAEPAPVPTRDRRWRLR